MQKRTWFFGVLLLGLLVVSGEAKAASLYIDPAFSSINRGDAINLAVRLNVDRATGECVNAVDAVITYSENISPVDISLGDSIFSIWVEQPTINQADRTITFAGGIPNGYCGRVPGDPRLTNNLVTLVFRSPGFTVGGSNDDSNALVTFAPETTAYLNDGLGTRADLTNYGAQIELLKTPGQVLTDPWREAVALDNIPPEEFSINLERTKSAFGGRYFITFNTTDKQTGIDQYQVMEEPLRMFGAFEWGRADAPWITTRSPYQLKDQSLNSIIRVRAIDKAGNEYIATLIPGADQRRLPTEVIITFIGIAFVVLTLIGIITVAIRSRRSCKVIKADAPVDPENTL